MLERIGNSVVQTMTLRLPDQWQGSYLFVDLPRRMTPSPHRGANLTEPIEMMEHAHADPCARERIPNKPTDASMDLSAPSLVVARHPVD